MTKFQAPKGVSEYVPPRSNAFAWVRSTLETTSVEAPMRVNSSVSSKMGSSSNWYPAELIAPSKVERTHAKALLRGGTYSLTPLGA